MQKRMKPAAPGHSRPLTLRASSRGFAPLGAVLALPVAARAARILARVCAFGRGAGIAGCGSRCAHLRAGLRHNHAVFRGNAQARCAHLRAGLRCGRFFLRAQASKWPQRFQPCLPWSASSCARKPASSCRGFNHVRRGALLLARASQQVAAAVSTMFAKERFFLRCARASKQV